MGKLNKVESLIGLAQKAGKIASGEFSAEKAIQSFRAELVIVAENASDNTKKHFRDMCDFREIPFITYDDRERLAQAIGKEVRVVLAVNDAGFAKAIQKALQDMNQDKSEVGNGETENS
ncbi:MAG: ribosomal L7Ae/L30e/S12e/Gadd45 family protein [Lachnospiraceae bacterium]|nr:ribosomal L7Ae/L30e/S12e/Gadd45 family protein [Lachnospiraceae bacterium]